MICSAIIGLGARMFSALAPVAALLLLVTACESRNAHEDGTGLRNFASRYAAAWSAQDPDAFASFYAQEGSLRVNDGEPAIGRDAIAQMARGFMEAFPDMLVRLDELRLRDDYVEFHWHWTGTNTGPGGTGNAVDLHGFERWTLDGKGLILESLGHLDNAEYQRQLRGGDEGTGSLPDPLEAGWRGNPVCELLHKNQVLRVLRCAFPPGAGQEKHFHAPHFGYAIAGGRMRIVDAGGTRELDLATGSSYSSADTAWHEVLNTGDTEVIYLIVEAAAAQSGGSVSTAQL